MELRLEQGDYVPNGAGGFQRLEGAASEALGMERGVSSDRKHLSAMQYKTECAKEKSYSSKAFI